MNLKSVMLRNLQHNAFNLKIIVRCDFLIEYYRLIDRFYKLFSDINGEYFF